MSKRTLHYVDITDEFCEPTLVFVNGKLSNPLSAPADARKRSTRAPKNRKGTRHGNQD